MYVLPKHVSWALLLCYAVKWLCYAVNLLCYAVKFLCYAVKFLCYAVRSRGAVQFSCLKINVSALLLVKYSLHY